MLNDKKELIMEHLLYMLSNHEYRFEESLAKFMLINLGKDFLKSHLLEGVATSNYSIKTSLYGYINMKFIESCSLPFSDSYYELSGKSGEEYKKSTQDKAVKEQIKIDIWKKLLNDISPDLTVDKSCKISKWSGAEEVSFSLWYALCRPSQWATNYIKNPEIWKLTLKEEKILASELVHVNQRFNLSFLDSYHQKEETGILLNIFIKHSQALRSDFLNQKTNPARTVQDWTDQIFNSSGMKALIEQGDLKDVSKIFDQESLKSLLKKTNLKQNVENYPEMLANILPIAPAEQWINSCTVKGKFNINSFFDNKFIRGYGRSLTKNLNKVKSRHAKAQKALEQELSYLSQFLNTNYVKNQELIEFWDSVIKTRDFDLLKACSKYVGLPDVNDVFENKKFHSNFDSLKEDFNINNKIESICVKEFYMSERLNYSLQEKEQPAVRKIKI